MSQSSHGLDIEARPAFSSTPAAGIARSSQDGANESGVSLSHGQSINHSGIHIGSSAGATGSLPRQYPGRTSYFRAPSGASSNPVAFSLTQSHFDIREGSARLASLGLAAELDEEEQQNDALFVPHDRGRPAGVGGLLSQTWANNGQDAFARRHGGDLAAGSSRGRAAFETTPHSIISQSPSEGLGLSRTPIASGQSTPSGLSVLLQKHEGTGSSSSSPLSSSPSAASTSTQKPSPLTSTSANATPASEGQHPEQSKAADPEDSGDQASHVSSMIMIEKRTQQESGAEQHAAPRSSRGDVPIRKSTLEVVLEQPTLSLPASYSERSPLLRFGDRTSSSNYASTNKDISTRQRRPSESRSPSSDRRFAAEQAGFGTAAAARWVRFFEDAKSKLVSKAQDSAESASTALRKRSLSDLALTCILEPVKTLPAVILGILMNLLDGVSYGMIMFPVSSPVFTDFGGIGVSMFFASCFVSQLVYTSRSIFKGGNGSMMIEVVPFLHVIAFSISDRMGGVENAHAVIATTMVAYALSSVLTGLAFFLLGYLRLGAYIEFFPRVVLVGCIGGVGAFLVITGVEVCAGLENEHLEFSLELIKRFFEVKLFILWFIPLVLATVIRVVTSSRFDHPLVFPAFFLLIPIVFYIVVFAARIPMDTLREGGWIFQLQGVNTPWYKYFQLYDFKATDFKAIVETIPTQLALVFFALLHVPINVPALALSVGEDNVQTDTELVNHGLSNFFAGCVGSIPNYLVYTNSVLFYRVGGTTRLSSFVLALATLAVFLVGPWVIGYLPVMIVGTLIYILGYDLLKEAVWDTYGRVSGFEYATIWIIVAAMTYFDFVIGIGVGIVAACVSFVIVSSQRQPIRAIISGSTASSTVRRHPRQSTFLRRVGSQTRIIKLQSFLFFGTVVKVEAKIRELLEAANWADNPIRFLILDFSLASGVDFSAAEAFLRIQRLLEVREVTLVLCGCDQDTPIGKALQDVELFRNNPEDLVQVFSTLNDALEHCENSQLRSLYSKTLEPPSRQQVQDTTRLGIDSPYRLAAQERPSDLEAFSPRRAHLLSAAKETLVGKKSHHEASSTPVATAQQHPTTPIKAEKAPAPEPVRLLIQCLGSYAPELKEDFYTRLVPYFTKMQVAKGAVLWSSHDMADSFYVLEAGILKAVYNFPAPFLDTSRPQTGADPAMLSESMLPGTIAGEMTFLAGTRRNATVFAERDCTLWKMDVQNLRDLEEKEGPGISRSFRQVLLRVSAESADVLLGHLISG